MERQYETPELRELGSLETLTQQPFKKVGHQPDMFSVQPHGRSVSGSMMPQ
jgi:hypothetical protein